MNAEGIFQAMYPYGLFFRAGRKWLAFFESVWTEFEDCFHKNGVLTDQRFEEIWEAFYEEWGREFWGVAESWADIPIFPGREKWYRLLYAFEENILTHGELLGSLIRPTGWFPEIWQNLSSWFSFFPAWFDHIEQELDVVAGIHGRIRSSSVWNRYQALMRKPGLWYQRTARPLRDLRRRIRSYGDDWPVEERIYWNNWVGQGLFWTREWYGLWFTWILLPLSSG